MSRGPLPSTRCLLSSLPARTIGDKVRFLGCVTSYMTHSARLSLEHPYPRTTDVKAIVDVRLLLEGLDHRQTDVGQWVHVIGYVTSIHMKSVARWVVPGDATTVSLQAIVLWTAEDLDIASYERTFSSSSDTC